MVSPFGPMIHWAIYRLPTARSESPITTNMLLRHERLPALAAELVSSKVDLIVNEGGRPTALAENATSTIPIVTHRVFNGASRITR
jgi:hypothetical protein